MTIAVMETDHGIFEEEKRKEREREEASRKAKDLDIALASVMSTKAGRSAVAWMISVTACDASITCDNALRMAAMSGRRDVGLQILSRLRAACPMAVDLMIKEQRDA